MSDFLLNQGIIISIILGAVGLGYAVFLIKQIMASSAGNDAMKRVAAAIQEGAKAYLRRQVTSVSIIAVIITILLFIWKRSAPVPVGFIIGAVCSMIAGFIGMRVAVVANVRTTQAATVGHLQALRVAFNGGAVTGLLVVGLALLSVALFYIVMSAGGHQAHAIDSLVGLALGASLVSVFARLGGGIYTKAADVGADLVGKNENALDEDDPRNPATIADNVGDNVGDCAGMAADVFETYAVTLIGALLIASLSKFGDATQAALMYPFLIGGISIVGAVLGILWVNIRKGGATALLMQGVGISAVVTAVLAYPVTQALFGKAEKLPFTANALYFTAIIGLVLTWLVVLITNYYTSTEHAPVRKIAKASETGHATNIIAGISIGNYATALPVLLICASIAGGYMLAGLYGIAIAVMSMLSMAGIIVSLDAFGPITDNAGGIAVMSELPKEVRKITDELDAVGNTMKAVTKGYAIASAGVAALVLFGSFYLELEKHLGHVVEFSLKDPSVIIGLFIGGLLPFLFTAMSMNAVGNAAGAVVQEVRRQISAKPGILTGKDTPEYATCVDIVTKAALREMILPALLPIIGVLGVGWGVSFLQSNHFLGHTALGGMLMGTIVTGLFLGLSMTSAGGAWDNAKKYIEEGNHGGKGSDAHKAAVTGDTVGDPYKDTSGPAINPMIKVVNIVAILVIPLLF
ncbi:K(+)-stimulated pyrophosphate-energized sodium pump [Roseimicrobium gellanilyticum]|uniref:K(+)-insensitive pyrophosphate-energized proton pump n=1 Tax=Roseimicrobium gellanilyticum TaxID=748857 RepID=A0A366HRG5_9BACT|nr:sodium-translocating pyrophosphatase [Roseimicrobium gellanilyticum]RBP46271.1 K(+)-stimulated pyrophosphate-energized sodium pump [Roseimicrobium gellanilyticum]